MTLVTMLISAVLLFFLLRGAFRGLSGELAPLCGVAAGLSIVYGVYPYLKEGIDRFFAQADSSNRLFYAALGVLILGAVGYFATAAIIRRLTRRCLPQPYDAIFGALFESTLNPETRRAGGMVYTSSENIHKLIDPLFLDELEPNRGNISMEVFPECSIMCYIAEKGD